MWEAEGERTFPYGQTLIMGEWMLEQQGKGRTSNEGQNEYMTDLVALENSITSAVNGTPTTVYSINTSENPNLEGDGWLVIQIANLQIMSSMDSGQASELGMTMPQPEGLQQEI